MRVPWVILLFVGASTLSGQQSEAPYGIARRPMPVGQDVEALLPATVGAFERPPLAKNTPVPTDDDVNVTYVAGSDSVFFGFSMPGSPADAQAGVETTREEALASKVDLAGSAYATRRDPSYFKTSRFMSWSRGGYFFYANASSASALDRFMAAFPY